jgi:NADH:ubiquinone oxidoreductase subunit 3 (subunit A)
VWLAPPLAFVVYALLGVLITGLGRLLAGPPRPSRLKSSTYASGEAAPRQAAAPGYGAYFVPALFFGMLHLGILVAATSTLTPGVGLFLLGLMAALLVLVLG